MGEICAMRLKKLSFQYSMNPAAILLRNDAEAENYTIGYERACVAK